MLLLICRIAGTIIGIGLVIRLLRFGSQLVNLALGAIMGIVYTKMEGEDKTP